MKDAPASSHGKRILVGTDFSPFSEVAIRRAGALAHVSDGELELIHVVAPGDAPVYRIPGWEANRRALKAQAMVKLRTLASRAKERFRIPVRVELAFGSPHAEIAARAISTDAVLVVVGAHGERVVRDLLIGSTAQRLHRNTRVPLLIARDRSARGYRRILVAIDFSRRSAEAAHAAATLFPNAELYFVHVCEGLLENRFSTAGVSNAESIADRDQMLLQARRELDDFIRSYGLEERTASALVKEGDAAARIDEVATEVSASVVAFGAKGKSRMEAGIFGSVSGQFLRCATHDVLLAKERRHPTRRASNSRKHDGGGN